MPSKTNYAAPPPVTPASGEAVTDYILSGLRQHDNADQLLAHFLLLSDADDVMRQILFHFNIHTLETLRCITSNRLPLMSMESEEGELLHLNPVQMSKIDLFLEWDRCTDGSDETFLEIHSFRELRSQIRAASQKKPAPAPGNVGLDAFMKGIRRNVDDFPKL